MALLYIDSFDHYDEDRYDDPKGHLLAKWTSEFLATEIAVGLGRCGTNALKLGGFCDLLKGIPFVGNVGTIGFAYMQRSHYTLANSVIAVSSIYGTLGNWHLYLGHSVADGSLYIKNNVSGGVILGQTTPDLIRQDRWYFIEWQFQIQSAGGWVVVRVNGVDVLNLQNVQTADPAKTPDLRAIHFSSGSNEEFLVDDLYVLDATGPAPWNTFLGDCRVEYLRPSAAGSWQDFEVVGNKATHWEAVDDGRKPDDDASYIKAIGAPGAVDTQRYTPTGLPSGSIFGVQVNILAKKADSGPRRIAPVYRDPGGTQHIGPDQAPSEGTYRFHIQTYQQNPVSGAPWTITDVNFGEFGVKVTV